MQQITAARVSRELEGPWVAINAGRDAETPPWWLTVHDTFGLPPGWAPDRLAVDGSLEEAYEAAEEILNALTRAAADLDATKQRLASQLRRWTDTAQRIGPGRCCS